MTKETTNEKKKSINIRDFIAYNSDNIIDIFSGISVKQTLNTNTITNYGLKIMAMTGAHDNQYGSTLARNKEHGFAHLQITRYTTDSTGFKNYEDPMYVYVTRNAQYNNKKAHLVLADYVAESNGKTIICVLCKQFIETFVLEDLIKKCPFKKIGLKNGKYIYRFDITQTCINLTNDVNFSYKKRNSNNFFPNTKYIEYFRSRYYRAKSPLTVIFPKSSKYFPSTPALCEFLKNKNIIKINENTLRSKLNRHNNELKINIKMGEIIIRRNK